jgi:DNA-binding XRE family transcriptional regulator
MSGFVYVIGNSNGLFKIGFTNDPARRLTMLRTSTADKLTLLGVVPATPDHEKQLHHLFRACRVAREWFRWSPAMQPLLDGLLQLNDGKRGKHASLISERMEALGISDAELARRVGLERSMVTKIKLGKASPSLKRAIKLAKELDMPADAFFFPKDSAA